MLPVQVSSTGAMTRLIIRKAEADDLPFILSSWLSSHSEFRRLSPKIPPDLYFKLHRPVVEDILSRPTTTIHMAVNAEEPSLIYGYAVFETLDPETNIFHYVYVKRAFNDFGIATTLIKSAPFDMYKAYITHLTHRGMQCFSKYNFNYCFYFLYPVKTLK